MYLILHLKNENIIKKIELNASDADVQIIKNSDLEELQELGSGTFGTVYHGKWRGTDVAIKRIKKSCFSGRSSEQERLVGLQLTSACTHEVPICFSSQVHINFLIFYIVFYLQKRKRIINCIDAVDSI